MGQEGVGLFWANTGLWNSFFFLCPGEDSNDLIRHFLIESSAKGVHLKGADEEPYFGELPQPPGPWGGSPTLLSYNSGPAKPYSCRATCFPAGSLSAFVCQHSIMALALPCKLAIPQKGRSEPQGGKVGCQTCSFSLERLLMVTFYLVYGLL